MKRRYPKQLSYEANNSVIALNETEAAKIFSDDTRSDIGSEAEKLKFANSINSLMVKFIRLDVDQQNSSEMLVMERIYPWTTAIKTIAHARLCTPESLQAI
jgi:hypothetical protein